MALVMVEPPTMAISRSSPSNGSQDNIDYRMLPRSSGDGMEHASSHTESISNSSTPKFNKNASLEITSTNTNVVESSQTKYNDISSHDKSSRTSYILNHSGNQNSVSYHRKESSDYTRKNTLKSHEDLHQLEEKTTMISMNTSPNIELIYQDSCYLENNVFNFQKEAIDEHDSSPSTTERMITNVELSELEKTIKELEERNVKLVEDKTKLCVQLGLQTEVNSELKRLVVAAVGEGLENNLEALLMRNAQSAVEIKHWKTLSEEYAEESDKLAIECDVWRTKFMASRMMSDELSSWKSTLYTKFKQTQSALQRILNEREELKKYLINTERLLHVLGNSVNNGGASSKNISESLCDPHGMSQQSVLELGSVINCLVKDITTNLLNETQSISVPPDAIADNPTEKQNMQPTPGEKLAMQVLASDVELHTEEQSENSTVMKRLGKQYIGNGYQSRLMTNSFRVTYDCCDRCKGAVQIV